MFFVVARAHYIAVRSFILSVRMLCVATGTCDKRQLKYRIVLQCFSGALHEECAIKIR